MFPLAHAWLLEQLVPAPTPAHYLGCVWPDMLFESPLSHPQSHQEGARLADLARSQPPGAAGDELRAFVVGVLTHGSQPRGFDWYSDEHWDPTDAPAASANEVSPARGYAFQKARPLAEATAAACGLPAEMGWWKAHNLVEQAFEPDLYAARPARGAALTAACADTNLHARVAAFLAPHYGVSAESLIPPMRRYTEVVTFQPTSFAPLARTYALQVAAKHGTMADTAALERLLAEAHALIADDGQSFLAICAARVGAMLAEMAP